MEVDLVLAPLAEDALVLLDLMGATVAEEVEEMAMDSARVAAVREEKSNLNESRRMIQRVPHLPEDI